MKAIFYNCSLKQKLMMIILFTCGVVLCVFFTAFTINEVTVYHRAISEELIALAGIIDNNTSAGIMFNDRQDVQKTLSGLSANPRVLALQIFNSEGALFAQYVAPNVNAAELNIDSGEQSVTMPRQTLLVEDAGTTGMIWGSGKEIKILKRIVLDNNYLGTIVIHPNMQGLSKQLSLFFIIASVLLLIMFIIAYIISNKLQQVVSEPILKLVHTMNMVSQEKTTPFVRKKPEKMKLGN
jgi:two-component system sensor histidine kinase/response regulator